MNLTCRCLLLLGLSILAGCGENDEIRTEKVPKPAPAVKPGPGPLPIEYQAPPGWKETGPRPLILTAFSLEGGGPGDEVTIVRLSGKTGGELANINRWRGQIGLDPVAAAPEPVEVQIGGVKGGLHDFVGPTQRMLLAVVRRPGQTWYFKLTAAKAVAFKNRTAFDAFLKSVNFPGAKG